MQRLAWGVAVGLAGCAGGASEDGAQDGSTGGTDEVTGGPTSTAGDDGDDGSDQDVTTNGSLDESGPDDDGESDTSSDDGIPTCASDDDCPGDTICNPETMTCICDPRVAFCPDEVPPGHWVELEGTPLSDVLLPVKTVPGNPSAVIAAWSGGVYDEDRDRLVVWGGGHADYSGNEVYAFDLATLAWERLNDASLDVGGDEASGYYPDGLPRSRHTYDYLIWVPSLGMCSAGGAGMWMSGQVNTTNVDCFDFDTLTWSAYAAAPEGTIAGIADYDPVTDRIAYVGGPQLRYLMTYDVAGDAWTSHGDNFTNGGLGITKTGRVDPQARRFVAVGGGDVYTWDLDAVGDTVEVALAAANPPPELGGAYPGLDFDDELQRLVYWGGGTSVWSLDLDGENWEEHPVAADNTVEPPPPVTNGTFGRFRYVPSYDVFVLVNEASDNVYLRRL